MKMEYIIYWNSDILNLFYIHSECNKITSKTYRRFNELYPNLPALNESKFWKISTKSNDSVTSMETFWDICMLIFMYQFLVLGLISEYLELLSGEFYKNILGMYDSKFISLQALHRNDPQKRVEWFHFNFNLKNVCSSVKIVMFVMQLVWSKIHVFRHTFLLIWSSYLLSEFFIFEI